MTLFLNKASLIKKNGAFVVKIPVNKDMFSSCDVVFTPAVLAYQTGGCSFSRFSSHSLLSQLQQ